MMTPEQRAAIVEEAFGRLPWNRKTVEGVVATMESVVEAATTLPGETVGGGMVWPPGWSRDDVRKWLQSMLAMLEE